MSDDVRAMIREGIRLRDAAVEAVTRNSADWQPWARLAAYTAACRNQTLNSDEIWPILREHGIPDPADNRAMGGVMTALANRGVLTKMVGEQRPTSRPEAHRNPKTMYWSNVFGQQPPPWPTATAPNLQPATAAARGHIDQVVSPLRAGGTPAPRNTNPPCPHCSEPFEMTRPLALTTTYAEGYCRKSGKWRAYQKEQS